jgi:Rho GDP-dissociation inhibitor/dynein assembly factor 5
MSEKVSTQEVVDDEDVINYKPPPEKTLEEIINADKEDESLKKYKEALLGNATKDEVIVDPTDPNRVIVKSLALLADGRPDVVLDLSKGLFFQINYYLIFLIYDQIIC